LGDGSGLKQHGSGRYAPYTLLLAQYSLLILQNYDTNRKSRGSGSLSALSLAEDTPNPPQQVLLAEYRT